MRIYPCSLPSGSRREFRDAIRLVVFVSQCGSDRYQCSVICLADPVHHSVFPVQFPEFAVPLSGVKIHLLAADRDNRQFIIQLIPVEIPCLQHVLIAIHNGHSISPYAGCTDHGDEQPGNLIRSPSFLIPDIRRRSLP